MDTFQHVEYIQNIANIIYEIIVQPVSTTALTDSAGLRMQFKESAPEEVDRLRWYETVTDFKRFNSIVLIREQRWSKNNWMSLFALTTHIHDRRTVLAWFTISKKFSLQFGICPHLNMRLIDLEGFLSISKGQNMQNTCINRTTFKSNIFIISNGSWERFWICPLSLHFACSLRWTLKMKQMKRNAVLGHRRKFMKIVWKELW